MLGRATCTALLFGCLSCAPAAKAPDAPPATQAQTKSEQPPDLSPVSAPENLVAVGRVRKPRMLVETVLGWAGLPVSLRQMLPADLRGLEGLLEWDAPLEIAAVLNPEASNQLAVPLMVASVGLSSVEGARGFVESHGGHATRIAPGVYRVQIQEANCAIAASVGASPARLVCSDEWADVEHLLPYATRGLPRETLSESDAFFELRLRPIERRYRDQIRSLRVLSGLLLRQIETDDARLDRALTDVIYALADELMQIATEADRVNLMAKLDNAGRFVDISYGLSLQGSASTFSQMMRETGRRAALPPPVFFRLPADAHSGGFSIAGDAARLTKLTSYLSALADAYLAREKLGARFRERVRAAIDAMPGVYSSSAYVSGGAAPAEGTTPAQRLAANVGWHVGVVEQRIDGLTKLFGDLVVAINDREFGKWLVDKRGLERGLIPKAKTATVRVPSFAAAGTAYALELPPKLTELILEASSETGSPSASGTAPVKPGSKPSAKPAKAQPLTISIVLASDGGQTWFAIADNQRTAVEKLVLAHGDTGTKLESLPGLAPLKTLKTVSGGFTTVESFTRTFAELAEKEGIDLAAGLTKVPERGRTPMLWWGFVTESGKDLSIGAQMRIPAAAIADAGALIVQSAGR